MHDPQRAKYAYATMTDAVLNGLTVKQGEKEELLDYLKQFKENRDIMKSLIGSDVLDQFITNSPEYVVLAGKKTEQDALKDEAFSKWMAYLFIKNAHALRYGSFMTDLIQQYSKGLNQF